MLILFENESVSVRVLFDEHLGGSVALTAYIQTGDYVKLYQNCNNFVRQKRPVTVLLQSIQCAII